MKMKPMHSIKKDQALLRKVPGLCDQRSTAPCSKPQQLCGCAQSISHTNARDSTCRISFFLQTPERSPTAAGMQRICHCSFAVILNLFHKDQGKLMMYYQDLMIRLLLLVVQVRYIQILHIKISQGQQVITLDKSNNTFEVTLNCAKQ